jgi:putative transposase
LTKNYHFRDMLGAAHDRGFIPDCVAFDGWYSGLENLKLNRSLGWRWLTRLKVNRRANLDRQGTNAVVATAIEAVGTVVHLESYVLIRVFKIACPDGDTEHWATDDVAMDELTRLGLAERTWAIENYHRG